MSDKTGGPAFPNFKQFDRFDEVSGWHIPEFVPVGGMTLRDYFAAKAMQSIGVPFDPSFDIYKRIAELSYMQADAMLAERNKDQP